jgi:hypothetical protein
MRIARENFPRSKDVDMDEIDEIDERDMVEMDAMAERGQF